MPYGKLVIDVVGLRIAIRECYARSSKLLMIDIRMPSAHLIPIGQVYQLRAKDGRLKGIKPTAVPNPCVKISSSASVEPKLAEAIAHTFVVRKHHSAVAESAEVFGRVERKRGRPRESTKWLIVEARANRLGSVPNQVKAVLVGEFA